MYLQSGSSLQMKDLKARKVIGHKQNNSMSVKEILFCMGLSPIHNFYDQILIGDWS